MNRLENHMILGDYYEDEARDCAMLEDEAEYEPFDDPDWGKHGEETE